MIKLELLHSFQLVATLGSITKAAEKKSLSVMAMSKQMSNLEARIDQPLFERSGRTMRLTEFGRQFKIEADKVLQTHDSLQNWLEDKAGHVTGKLRVLTQSHGICDETLIPWLNEFLIMYPELSLELDVKESLININDDEYDIFWGVSDYLGDRFPNLKRRQLWQSSYGIYASPEYLKREGTPETLEDLEHHFVVGYLYNQPSNVLVLQQHDKPLYKFLKQRVASVTGIVDLAISGLGLINAGDDTKQIISAVNRGQLIPVLQKYWWESAEIYVYFHNVRHPQPKVKAFIDFFLDKRMVWRKA